MPGEDVELSVRREVQEYVRASNDLAESAHENNGTLTNVECEMVVACIQTLQKIVLTYPHRSVDDEALAASLGVLPPVID